MHHEINNRIGEDFSLFGLLKFSFPSILNNFFSQLFKTLDDGLFVSRFVGKTALSGMNILNPVHFLQFAMNNLFAVGAPNLSSRKMGEGDQQEAKRIFTRVVIAAAMLGLLFGLTVNIFARQLLQFLGADDELIGYGLITLRTVYVITPISLVNSVFNAYFSTAGKPSMGLVCSLVNGTINISLDVLLIVVKKMGVLGAGLSTMAGELMIFIIGLTFFMDHRNEIHFVAPEGKILPTAFASMRNSLPQFINTLSLSLSALVMNYQMLHYVGNDGIAANSIVSDLLRILTSLFMGYTICIGPIISFNYGSNNRAMLRKLIKENAVITVCSTLTLAITGLIFRRPFISIFINANDNSELFYSLTHFGLTMQYLSLPFFSVCVMIPRMLTAVNRIKDSMICAIVRNVVLRIFCLITMPLLFGYHGVFVAGAVCEFLACCVDLIMFSKNSPAFGFDRPFSFRTPRQETQIS